MDEALDHEALWESGQRKALNLGGGATRAVVLHRREDGYWVVEVPSLPGCISQGKTKAEAIANIREAIEGWIDTASDHGQPIPDDDSETQVVCV